MLKIVNIFVETMILFHDHFDEKKVKKNQHLFETEIFFFK